MAGAAVTASAVFSYADEQLPDFWNYEVNFITVLSFTFHDNCV